MVLGLLLLSALCFAGEQRDHAPDLDHDGLADAFEQALLERFLPRFQIAAKDCDVMPSEFLAGRDEPTAFERNGAIYGQVFGRRLRKGEPPILEIHYFHLWKSDCGRWRHALDAEHVSVLLTAEKFTGEAAQWKAAYWHAAAHESTPCDASRGLSAREIEAEERGAKVWVSRGKHASFLSEEFCRGGCGQDRCYNAVELTPAKVVNIGEIGAPMNGAVWAASALWPLQRKMHSSFTEEGLDHVLANAALPRGGDMRKSTVQSVVSAGGTSLDAIDEVKPHVGMALKKAQTEAALGVSGALKKAHSAVRAWFRRASD